MAEEEVDSRMSSGAVRTSLGWQIPMTLATSGMPKARFVDAMNTCGFTLPAEPLHARTDIKAFVELHIEQGCVLESNGQSIGVVSAIVGQRRYTVTLNGESNHAGDNAAELPSRHRLRPSAVSVASRLRKPKHGDPLGTNLWQS